MNILFIYDHKYPELWKDGLWAALKLLKKDGFYIDFLNLENELITDKHYDFYLGWGAFNSPVDRLMQEDAKKYPKSKRGLCIAGNSFPPDSQDIYSVLFYETEWYLPQIMSHRNVLHAFGINADIYVPEVDPIFIWDWLTVGAFAEWKRQIKLVEKGGYRLAVGEVQKENWQESSRIITSLLTNEIMVSDMVDAKQLAKLYNASERVYIPADINGGGERAVLEARACGRPVEVEFDNPKLKELLKTPVWDHFYYFDQLKKGILSCF